MVAPPAKGACWMKIVNKTSFEHGVPPSVNKSWAPPGILSIFASIFIGTKLDRISWGLWPTPPLIGVQGEKNLHKP